MHLDRRRWRVGASSIQEGVGEELETWGAGRFNGIGGGKARVVMEKAAHPSCSESTHTSFRSKVWTLWPWKKTGHGVVQSPDQLLTYSSGPALSPGTSHCVPRLLCPACPGLSP